MDPVRNPPEEAPGHPPQPPIRANIQVLQPVPNLANNNILEEEWNFHFIGPANRQQPQEAHQPQERNHRHQEPARDARQPQPERNRRQDLAQPARPQQRERNRSPRANRRERLVNHLRRDGPIGPPIPGYARIREPLRRAREVEAHFGSRLNYFRAQIVPRLPLSYLDRRFVFLALPGCLEPFEEERAAMDERYGRERPDYSLLAFLALENFLPREEIQENFRRPKETRYISEDLRVAFLEKRLHARIAEGIVVPPDPHFVERMGLPRVPGQTGMQYFRVLFGPVLGGQVVNPAPGDGPDAPPRPQPQDLNIQGFDAAWFRQQIEKLAELVEKIRRRRDEEADSIYCELAKGKWLQLDHQIVCRPGQLHDLWEAAKIRGRKRHERENGRAVDDPEFEAFYQEYQNQFDPAPQDAPHPPFIPPMPNPFGIRPH